MKEFKQMFWMMLGVLGGFGVGLFIVLRIIQSWPTVADSPTLSLFVAVPVLGGGLAGGGFLAQWLVNRYERGKRKKRQAEKDASKTFGKKKK